MSRTWNKPPTLLLAEHRLGASFEEIASERTRAGKTDVEIAEELGVSRQTYRLWREAAGLKPQRELVAASSAS